MHQNIGSNTLAIIALSIAALALSACNEPGDTRDATAYTLYRSGAVLPGIPTDDSRALADMRIHVATFDATHGADYNRDNCDIARSLFGSQPAVLARYWCEKGVYRP